MELKETKYIFLEVCEEWVVRRRQVSIKESGVASDGINLGVYHWHPEEN